MNTVTILQIQFWRSRDLKIRLHFQINYCFMRRECGVHSGWIASEVRVMCEILQRWISRKPIQWPYQHQLLLQEETTQCWQLLIVFLQFSFITASSIKICECWINWVSACLQMWLSNSRGWWGESKVCHWKEIKTVKVANLLLNEVWEKQVGYHDEEVMQVDIDFSEETLKKYNFYEPAAFKFCQEHINSLSNGQGVLTDRDLAAPTAKIAEVQLPYYS